MKYLKRFESTIKERVAELNDIKFNIESLLIDLTDCGCILRIDNRYEKKHIISIDLDINRRRDKNFYDNIIPYLLSLTDYMDTVGYTYNSLNICIGYGYRRIPCKIIDGKFRKYPLKDDRNFEAQSVSNIEIDFRKK